MSQLLVRLRCSLTLLVVWFCAMKSASDHRCRTVVGWRAVHDEAIGVQYARVCTYAFTARCWISDAWVSVSLSALPTLYLL